MWKWVPASDLKEVLLIRLEIWVYQGLVWMCKRELQYYQLFSLKGLRETTFVVEVELSKEWTNARTWYLRPRKALICNCISSVFTMGCYATISFWTVSMIILIVYFEYMIGSFSFALTGKCNSMVELFASTGRDFDSTIKCNATTGNTVNQRANVSQWSNYLPQRAEIWIIFGNISRRWFTIKGLYLSINAFIPFPFASSMLQSMDLITTILRLNSWAAKPYCIS